MAEAQRAMSRHCEERGDEAIQRAPLTRGLDCFAALAMTAERVAA
jgi:hypothetical protein